MPTENITKRITNNQQSILLAKLRNFFRKSILMYFMTSLLIAIGEPYFFGDLFLVIAANQATGLD